MNARTMNARTVDAHAWTPRIDGRPFASSATGWKSFDWSGPATLAIGGAAWGSLAAVAWLVSSLLYL